MLERPTFSPNLNEIENLYAILKQRTENRVFWVNSEQ